MLLSIVQIAIAVFAFIILYYAYFKNNTLGKLSSFTILAAILLVQILNGFAGFISSIDFLDFLESILKSIAGLVIYAELIILVILAFFSSHKTKETLLKWSVILYIVLVLLIEFNVL